MPNMPKKIGSVSKIKNGHRATITDEALRIGVCVKSGKGFSQLREFAQSECGIIVDDAALRHLLLHKNGNKRNNSQKCVKHCSCAH